MILTLTFLAQQKAPLPIEMDISDRKNSLIFHFYVIQSPGGNKFNK